MRSHTTASVSDGAKRHTDYSQFELIQRKLADADGCWPAALFTSVRHPQSWLGSLLKKVGGTRSSKRGEERPTLAEFVEEEVCLDVNNNNINNNNAVFVVRGHPPKHVHTHATALDMERAHAVARRQLLERGM